MARIRTIKPEFPHSQSMGRVSRDARLLFVLLWTIADDSGRTRAASRMLASLLFPYDDDAPKKIDGWLGELERENCIALYRVDGDDYLEVCNWGSHQKIDRASPSKFPPRENAREDSTSPREDSSLDQGPRTKDQGEDRECAAAREPRSVVPPKPEDVTDQTWSDWLAHRRRKRAIVNETVLAEFRREAAAADVKLEEALKVSVAQGWQGFRADWVAKGRDGKPKAEPPRNITKSALAHAVIHDPDNANCECENCWLARRRAKGIGETIGATSRKAQ